MGTHNHGDFSVSRPTVKLVDNCAAIQAKGLVPLIASDCVDSGVYVVVCIDRILRRRDVADICAAPTKARCCSIAMLTAAVLTACVKLACVSQDSRISFANTTRPNPVLNLFGMLAGAQFSDKEQPYRHSL